jgi:hypothetical protein
MKSLTPISSLVAPIVGEAIAQGNANCHPEAESRGIFPDVKDPSLRSG